MKEGFCAGIGVVGGFIASLFGGWDAALITCDFYGYRLLHWAYRCRGVP